MISHGALTIAASRLRVPKWGGQQEACRSPRRQGRNTSVICQNRGMSSSNASPGPMVSAGSRTRIGLTREAPDPGSSSPRRGDSVCFRRDFCRVDNVVGRRTPDPFLPSITRAGCNAASAHCYLRSTERLPENPAASRAEGQSARFCCSRRASSRKHSVNRWAGGLSARPLKVTIATGPKVVGISIGRIFKGR